MTNVSRSVQKRFYNRETVAVSNYEIHKMSLIPPSLYATEIIHPFLHSRTSANHDKGLSFSQSEIPFTCYVPLV